MPDHAKIAVPANFPPIHHAASKSEGRYAMQWISVRPDAKLIEATDGKILARVPVEVGPGEHPNGSALLGLDVLKTAKKSKKPYTIEARLDGSSRLEIEGGITIEEPFIMGEYPKTDGVVPPKSDTVLRMDGALLIRLLKAIGGDKCGIEISVPAEPPGPVRIDVFDVDMAGSLCPVEGAHGVIMPITRDN